jgi:Uncharacterized protein conserved in bacteria (DUF2219).
MTRRMSRSTTNTKQAALGGLFFTVVAACLPGAHALADEANPLRSDDDGTITFIWENDRFGGTDRNYTNGNRISYLSPTQSIGHVSSRAARSLLGADGKDNIRYGLALGHSIFTPADTQATAPRPNQHPYAGYVYGEAACR